MHALYTFIIEYNMFLIDVVLKMFSFRNIQDTDIAALKTVST